MKNIQKNSFVLKKKVNLFFLILNLEFCCAFCLFRNLHNEHKVFEIKGEETLNENNISIENEKNEFDLFIQESNNLKEKILKEIEEINKTYKDHNKEISASFKKKHEDLTNKEKNLKDALKNEVNKIKAKLEEYYSETNEKIKEGERLIKSFEEEEERKNVIKTLTYISYINNKKKRN
jgi:DNA repair exonuclease SbcCD ATPase subunit